MDLDSLTDEQFLDLIIDLDGKINGISELIDEINDEYETNFSGIEDFVSSEGFVYNENSYGPFNSIKEALMVLWYTEEDILDALEESVIENVVITTPEGTKVSRELIGSSELMDGDFGYVYSSEKNDVIISQSSPAFWISPENYGKYTVEAKTSLYNLFSEIIIN